MAYDLSELVEKLNPRQTALLLGAGASMPSGAPSGRELGKLLAANGGITGAENYSLAEIAGLFEQRHGRAALAHQVRKQLEDLHPTGGLRLLPMFDWYRIYSTNFDTLVEQVYRDAGVELTTRRSNYDFSRNSEPAALEFYKIHGCVSEDVGFGHKSRMLLTEDDYDSFDDFRQASFKALESDILTKDFLVIGQSLEDAHLKSLIKDALKLQLKAGASGRVFVVAYKRDEGLAGLQQARGAEVYFGDLDTLFGALLDALPSEEVREDGAVFEPTLLPADLVSVTTDAAHAITLPPNARAVFNGSPASYADIASGHTFARTDHDRVVHGLLERPIAVLLGAGGVGKTTLARKVLLTLGQSADGVWEHNNSFPLRADSWIEYERRLREMGKNAVLLIDDCADYLSQVGRIADHIGRTKDCALRLVLTATTSKWKQRSKSRFVFSHGNAFTLSRLTAADIQALLTLTNEKQEIRELVEVGFLNLPRGEQARILRERCSADMYVCMKNIFAAEELDYILLREYGELDETAQEVYRSVAALEALGARVHRQLIMRLLQIEAGSLTAILDRLTGVVQEFDIKSRDGLYGWETRHREIATTIARYKFARQEELSELFENLLDSINPSVRLEVETARSLCSEPFGIDRLASPERQVDLIARVVKLLPGESIPRHRLIRHLIDQDRLDEAATELKRATDAIRPNPVLARYEVLVLSRRAELTGGLMEEDRVAILLDAHSKAMQIITRYPEDMHGYRVLGEVAVRLMERGNGVTALEDAVARARVAELRILDPALGEIRARLEADLRRAASRAPSSDPS